MALQALLRRAGFSRYINTPPEGLDGANILLVNNVYPLLGPMFPSQGLPQFGE